MLCFLFCHQRFCISLATLKNPWILNQNALKKKKKKKNSKEFLKHLVSDGQMELFVKHKCTFIWCSYHFNTPYCVNLHYPQSKREILFQKEKQYSAKLHDFFHILCRMDLYFKRLMIYQIYLSNIRDTSSVTVLSNLQFKLILSMLKKMLQK